MSGTAAAAPSLLTVTRTSSLPACARRATWIAVASESAVSVFVIDWTTTGWLPPTPTPPTSTVTVGLRELLMASRSWRGAARAETGDVEARDPQDEREEEHHAHGVGEPLGAEAHARPEQALDDQDRRAAAVERRERQ